MEHDKPARDKISILGETFTKNFSKCKQFKSPPLTVNRIIMPATVVVGAQWGDEGKGKIVDLLASEKDFKAGARYNGGPNAGHTVVVDGETYKLHHLPSALIMGKKSFLGNGMVIDPEKFFQEVDDLKERGKEVSPDRLRVSKYAHIITPQGKKKDGIKGGKIGTTGRGIGPTYSDKMDRTGIRVEDLIRPEILKKKLKQNLSEKNFLFKNFYDDSPVDLEEVFERYKALGQRMKPLVTDVSLELNAILDSGGDVLLEGAQGTFLDIDHGTYPYVSSSNSTAGGACTGLGIGPQNIERIIGTAKAYITRVGKGQFPTEREGKWAEEVREDGKEYGTTTGRPRRVGDPHWGMLKQSVRINGITEWAVTKLDVLGGKEFNVARKHKNGKDFDPQDKELIYSDKKYFWEKMTPEDREEAVEKGFDSLPEGMKQYLLDLAGFTGVPVRFASIGPEREMTVIKDIFKKTSNR